MLKGLGSRRIPRFLPLPYPFASPQYLSYPHLGIYYFYSPHLLQLEFYYHWVIPL